MRLLASNDYVKDNSLDLASENNQTSLTNGKSQYSLLQFALQNFVQAIDKYVFDSIAQLNDSISVCVRPLFILLERRAHASIGDQLSRHDRR